MYMVHSQVLNKLKQSFLQKTQSKNNQILKLEKDSVRGSFL